MSGATSRRLVPLGSCSLASSFSALWTRSGGGPSKAPLLRRPDPSPAFPGEVPEALPPQRPRGPDHGPRKGVVRAVEAQVGASLAKMATLSGEKVTALQGRVSSANARQTAAVEAHRAAMAKKAKTIARLLVTVRDGYVKVGEDVGLEVKDECTEETYMFTGDVRDYGTNNTDNAHINNGATCYPGNLGWKFAKTSLQRSQLRSWVIHPKCNSCDAKEKDVTNVPYVDRSVLRKYGDGDACAPPVPTRLDALSKT